MKNSSIITVLRVIGIISLVGCLMGAFIYLSQPSDKVEKMEVIFIKTKDDADCTLLLNRDKTIMIDTGELQDFDHIQEVLNQYNIKKIDCLILTHPDKDHIGSALEIAKNYSLGMVIEPYYAKEDERFDTFNQYLEDNRVNRLILSRNRHFVYGDINFIVSPPNEYEYNNDNNYSLAIQIKHQNISMFFAGDAEKKRTAELLALFLSPVDLYKASYHGRDYEGANDLLKVLQPKEVIITAKEAGRDLKKQLEIMNCHVYSTLEGDIHYTSDGNIIKKED